MKFSEMPYRRVEKAVLDQISRLTERLTCASSAEEAEKIFMESEAISTEVQTMMNLCYIRSTIDTTDEFYAAEQEYNDELTPLLTEKSQEFSKALCASPFRRELEKKWGTLLFTNAELSMKGFAPELVPLLQEENALTSQYQKLYASAKIDFDGKVLTVAQLAPYKQSADRAVRKAAYEAEGSFFDANREQFDEIYDKLVKNRTAQAKKLGYENYLELGYIRLNRNCYGPADVARFRRQVVESMVPVVAEIKKAQAKRIGIADMKFYDDNFFYPDGNATPQGTPEELLAAGEKMYTEMSPETAEFAKLLFGNELFDVLAKPGKAPGGYCTSLPAYKAPFIFSNFNGTAGDVDVLTHEAGHAFADYVAARTIPILDLRSPTMEGCETHSMSMEFFTAPWHRLFFKEQTEKYEVSHAEDALIFIPYGSMVDHFQELMYTHPEMTPEERNETWLKLERQYRPYLDFEDLPFYSRGAGWQRQLHIYQYPFYYVDYCLAQSMALQFWMESVKDWKAAWKKYLKFVGMGGTRTFVDLIRESGLLSPLDDGSIAKIVGPVSKWLKENAI